MCRKPTNRQRVARVDKVIGSYKDRLGEDSQEYVLADLLADLRHWAGANGRDFENDNRLAQDHFDAERRANE